MAKGTISRSWMFCPSARRRTSTITRWPRCWNPSGNCMDAARFHLLMGDSSQLSRAWQQVLDWYAIFHADPWGSLYWGLVWVCAFVITFLLLRMLFTRWGESNVTQKTLGVSVLVHVMIGMVSNSVIFLPSGGVRSHDQPGVPIRRVVFES